MKPLTAGEFAKLFNISKYSIRHYIDKGILTPKRNEENKYYTFEESDIYRLLSILSHKPRYNERYIDFLTVAPEFRNMGIGKALVTHCKNNFPEKHLMLHVAKQNYNACQLYDKLEFEIIKEQSSFAMEFVVGISEWRLMKW